MRLFVALQLPTAVRERLAEAQARLVDELAGADIRWQRLEQSHLTLRFLGEVADRDLPGCRLAVNEAARRSRPFTLTTGRYGAFPGPRRPSVLWLGVTGDLDELNRLQARVARGLDRLAQADDSDTFKPHLTLGRVRRLEPQARDAYGRLLAGEAPAAASWRVESVLLMASELRPGGPRYRELLEAGLSG